MKGQKGQTGQGKDKETAERTRIGQGKDQKGQ